MKEDRSDEKQEKQSKEIPREERIRREATEHASGHTLEEENKETLESGRITQ